jgi:hypothetical protein
LDRCLISNIISIIIGYNHSDIFNKLKVPFNQQGWTGGERGSPPHSTTYLDDTDTNHKGSWNGKANLS